MKVIKSLLDRCWSNCQLPLILLLALMQIRRIDGKSYCNRTLGQLANMQGEFTDCITKHSVPVTVCQNCQDIYRNMTQLYQNILNCSIFFDSDQLNLLPSTEQVLTNLWTKAACNDCINNGSKYDEFITAQENLQDCFHNHTDNVCASCETSYRDLDYLYRNWYESNSGKICFDIKDKMNRTRHKWSAICSHPDADFTWFLVSVTITMALPLIFYVATYLLISSEEQNHGLLNNLDPDYTSTPPLSRNILSNDTNQVAGNSGNSNNPLSTLSPGQPSTSTGIISNKSPTSENIIDL